MKKLVKSSRAKKKPKKPFRVKITILILLLVFIAINLYIFFFLNFEQGVTGSGISTVGYVGFEIVGPLEINITHPVNGTQYNFSIGDIYTLDLNVTANFDASNWRYDLYDLRHNEWVWQNHGFSPNSTIDAVRWWNQLFVTAYTETGENVTDNVTFFVFVNNSEPIMDPLDNPIYVCESSFLWYLYYAEDADEDPLTTSINDGHSYFYVPSNEKPISVDKNRSTFVLFSSGLLPKDAAGGLNMGSRNFSMTFNVCDNASHCVSEDTNLTVIEINNPPVIEEIGVQTIWNKGEDSTLKEFVKISDIEYDAPFSWGELNVNVTIKNESGDLVDLFNITRYNITHFIINFTANISTPLGVYDVLICANDTGITSTHSERFNVCNQTGESETTCEYFELTITDNNRPPTIIDYFPENLSLNVTGTQTVYFNITTYDPDFTIPDIYWYVDNFLFQYTEANSTDEFFYKFGCEIFGDHEVKAWITDGLENDSLVWLLDVAYVSCPRSDDPGGGGGGGTGSRCFPQWGCNTWGLCQHARVSLEVGILSGSDYRLIEQDCLAHNLDESTCGFQLRGCVDVNNCSSDSGKPEEVQYCHYVENPSCFDKVKNCHHGMCELLIDCGGPCDACPSCVDGIKNQGEEKVDCGGPCPWKCKPEIPLIKRKSLWYVFAGVALLLIAIIIIKLIRVLRYRKGIKEEKVNKEKV